MSCVNLMVILLQWLIGVDVACRLHSDPVFSVMANSGLLLWLIVSVANLIMTYRLQSDILLYVQIASVLYCPLAIQVCSQICYCVWTFSQQSCPDQRVRV